MHLVSLHVSILNKTISQAPPRLQLYESFKQNNKKNTNYWNPISKNECSPQRGTAVIMWTVPYRLFVYTPYCSLSDICSESQLQSKMCTTMAGSKHIAMPNIHQCETGTWLRKRKLIRLNCAVADPYLSGQTSGITPLGQRICSPSAAVTLSCGLGLGLQPARVLMCWAAAEVSSLGHAI